MRKILNHFKWSEWESIGEQLDSYTKCLYEVFKSVNKNGLSRYRKVVIVSASCHPCEAILIDKKIKGEN